MYANLPGKKDIQCDQWMLPVEEPVPNCAQDLSTSTV